MPSELVAVAPDASVMGDEMERVTPDGTAPSQTGFRVTVESKPFIDVRVIITGTSSPWNSVTEGVEASEKSGIAEVVVTAGVTTVNVDEPESPIGLPVAVTVYEAAETLLTVKEPVRAPFEMEQ